MYSRLRILYLILLIASFLLFGVLFFQNLQLSSMSFLHWRNFIPVAFGIAFAFLLGILSTVFAHLFISANREALYGEGTDATFKGEEL